MMCLMGEDEVRKHREAWDALSVDEKAKWLTLRLFDYWEDERRVQSWLTTELTPLVNLDDFTDEGRWLLMNSDSRDVGDQIGAKMTEAFELYDRIQGLMTCPRCDGDGKVRVQ